ncbi:MAG TPA: glycosyltransferase family 2 protein, partial [Thermoanaerobacterales bacterium]|nr:glycosyltransferase family 2 protein [Thermoanaerobacterales bacterium]
MLISAIIPAYNEEKTIGNVLSTLSSMDFIDEIIVVSDGSCDRTVSIAKRYNVRIIELSSNQGKSNAVLKGVSSTKADIILMLDADLIGLTREHVISLTEPIINDNVDMT